MREKNSAFPFDDTKNIDHWRIGGGGVEGIAIHVVSEAKIKLQYCYHTVTHSCAMVSYNQWRIERAEPPPPPAVLLKKC